MKFRGGMPFMAGMSLPRLTGADANGSTVVA
ncbi:hypothetical protein T03_16036 [Trichinella britovi]|uniref:Uncharacterized protein n=1 Tax=Trichinella britovi TaxID=45882 RepID=A0A0V1AP50_TRIBR|nr:hypothetical protein T03_16036 [Trichinella britovi]